MGVKRGRVMGAKRGRVYGGKRERAMVGKKGSVLCGGKKVGKRGIVEGYGWEKGEIKGRKRGKS